MAASEDKPDVLIKVESLGELLADRPASLSASSRPEKQRTSSPSRPPRRAATAPVALLASQAAATTSPKPSRETSPMRPSPLKLGQSAARRSRSRRNSQDLSPSRSPAAATTPTLPDTPSAAAVQRALSATGIPRLTSSSAQDSHVVDAQRQQRTPRSSSSSSSSTLMPGGTNPSRVKSPPRAGSLTRASGPSSRKAEQAPSTPSIVVENGTQNTLADIEDVEEEEEEGEGEEREEEEGKKEPVARSGLRSPSRPVHGGRVLEVVQESESLETPALGELNSQLTTTQPSVPSAPWTDGMTSQDSSMTASITQSAESGSDSAGSKLPGTQDTGKDAAAATATKPTAPRPTAIPAKKSFTQLPGSKNKIPGEGSARSMTVETETVTSVPHLTVGGNAGERGAANRSDGGGTVRLKPSSETIRPKKEKKRTARKTPSIHSGTASSKADIFAAKVASAVDEADSSDSEETFVYESNPPEPPTRTTTRFHSRTPSATSMASQADHYGNRYRADGHNSIVGKKSMKFVHNQNHLVNYQGDGENGSTQGTGGSNRHVVGNGSHHIGRHGRNAGHASLFDTDSPFPNAAGKQARNGGQARLSPRPPNAPRSPHVLRNGANGKSQAPNSYDLEGEGADDERTPLMASRSARARHGRRSGTRYGQMDSSEQRGFIRGLVGWIMLGLLIAVLIAAIIVALVLCSKSLRDVRIGDIRNVIATEEEIVFDLRIYATNPNIVAIQVDELDMKIFAKSKHVRPSRLSDGRAPSHYDWPQSNLSDVHEWDKVDEGTDPIGEPGGADTMLLGRVYTLDSPLTFAPSPFSQRRSSDFGEISLAKPGNQTADDGSDRWKIVVRQPFELIVMGQIKYTLPISSKVRSVSVGRGEIHVQPAESKAQVRGADTSIPSRSASPVSSIRTRIVFAS